MDKTAKSIVDKCDVGAITSPAQDRDITALTPMMREYGYEINTIIGPMENIKITTPTDFFIFRAMVEVHENQQIFGF